MTKECVELISAWVTIIGFPLAIIAIVFTYRQFNFSKKVEQAKFWLDLRQSFLIHNEVHLNLRNGGLWNLHYIGSQSVDDWAKIDAYLGQLELCQSMLEQKLINRQTFQDQYGYRLHNIVENNQIVNKINSEIDSWRQFIKLCKSFGYGKW